MKNQLATLSLTTLLLFGLSNCGETESNEDLSSTNISIGTVPSVYQAASNADDARARVTELTIVLHALWVGSDANCVNLERIPFEENVSVRGESRPDEKPRTIELAEVEQLLKRDGIIVSGVGKGQQGIQCLVLEMNDEVSFSVNQTAAELYQNCRAKSESDQEGTASTVRHQFQLLDESATTQHLIPQENLKNEMQQNATVQIKTLRGSNSRQRFYLFFSTGRAVYQQALLSGQSGELSLRSADADTVKIQGLEAQEPEASGATTHHQFFSARGGLSDSLKPIHIVIGPGDVGENSVRDDCVLSGLTYQVR